MALKPAHLQWSDEGILKSIDFDDIYFQQGQGREESHYVFIEQNQLSQRFQNLEHGSFCVGELGFGSGLNFLLTAQLFDQKAPSTARLFYVSIEKHPIRKEDLRRIYDHWPALKTYADVILAQYPPLIEGFHHVHFPGKRIHLMLLFGDVESVLPELEGCFDSWYLDGFSPAKNPGMWEGKIFDLLEQKTKPGGTLSSFSSAGHVRNGLAAAGFEVKKTKGFGKKRDMTIAQKGVSIPLSAPSPRTAVILGAGIAGCSAAYALAARGYKVSLVDRHDSVAEEASGNPFAIIYPKLTVDAAPLGRFHSHAFCFTRQLMDSLQLQSWHASGVVHMDLSSDDRARSQEVVNKNGYPDHFAACCPDLSDVSGINLDATGLYQPSAGFFSPREFCQALVNHPNVKISHNISCSLLQQEGGRWSIYADDKKIAEADIVVVAMGYESLKIKKELPLQSLRGQVTYIKATPTSQKLKTVICHDGYITPAIDGQHTIGATFQKEAPGEYETREEDHVENIDKLNRNLPMLGLVSAKAEGGRTGFRATTPDKLPLIGLCPDYDSFKANFSSLRVGKLDPCGAKKYQEGLYIATGFGSHGMTGAPLAGEIIAAQIAGDPLPVPKSLLEYLVPERFIFRDLKRKKI